MAVSIDFTDKEFEVLVRDLEKLSELKELIRKAFSLLGYVDNLCCDPAELILYLFDPLQKKVEALKQGDGSEGVSEIGRLKEELEHMTGLWRQSTRDNFLLLNLINHFQQQILDAKKEVNTEVVDAQAPSFFEVLTVQEAIRLQGYGLIQRTINIIESTETAVIDGQLWVVQEIDFEQNRLEIALLDNPQSLISYLNPGDRIKFFN